MPEITEQYRAAQIKALVKKFKADLLLESSRVGGGADWHPLRDTLVAQGVLAQFFSYLRNELIEPEDLIAVCLNVIGVCERWLKEQQEMTIANG
jgi:hypothetical protein